MSLNITVLFCGHLRTFRDCIPRYQRLFKGCNVRYFMHTWSNVWPDESSWHSLDLSAKEIAPQDLWFIQEQLPNIEICIEDQSQILRDMGWDSMPVKERVFRLINYSQRRAFELAGRQEDETIFFYTRPDIILDMKLYQDLKGLVDKQLMILGNGNRGCNIEALRACDIVNIGRSHVISAKLNYFDKHTDEFESKDGPNGQLYKKFSDEKGIEVVRLPYFYNRQWTIKRPGKKISEFIRAMMFGHRV